MTGATLLVIAADQMARAAIGRALAEAGHRVILLARAADAEAVIRGLAVDALVVHGGPEAIRSVEEVAGATPWIEVEWAAYANAAVTALLSINAGEATAPN